MIIPVKDELVLSPDAEKAKAFVLTIHSDAELFQCTNNQLYLIVVATFDNYWITLAPSTSKWNISYSDAWINGAECLQINLLKKLEA